MANLVKLRKRTWTDKHGKKHSAWIMDYVDPLDGKRKRPVIDVERKSDAEEIAQARWLLLQKGKPAESEGEADLTLETLLKHHLERPGISPINKRVETYRMETLKRLIGTKLQIIHMKTSHLVNYQVKRSAEVSHGTVNDELGILHAAIVRAKKHGLFTFTPCEFPTKLPEDTPRRRFLQPAQVEALFVSLKEIAGEATADVAEFIYRQGGMRPTEVWNLTWGDIDSERNTVRIRSPKRGSALSYSVRVLPLAKRAIAILERRLTPGEPMPRSTELVFGKLPQERAKKYSTAKKLGHLGGVPYFGEHGFNKKLKKAAKAAGIPHPEQISGYVLRHSAATNSTGADITDVAYMLGHSDPRLTLQVYRHVRMDRVQAGLDALAGHTEGTEKTGK